MFSIHKTLGVSLSISVLGAFIFMVAAIFFPHILMHLFTRDPIVIQQGSDYLKIVGLSYLFTAISFSKAFARRVLQKSFPVIANEFLWAIGISLYVAAFARSGTEAYAAYQIPKGRVRTGPAGI